MSTPTELVRQIKTHFENRDFESLMKVMCHVSEVPDRSSEEQSLDEEFEIHFEDLKNEAIKQFDQELYGECLATFEFLCKLEPENRTLRDYLELCQQLIPGVRELLSKKDVPLNSMVQESTRLEDSIEVQDSSDEVPLLESDLKEIPDPIPIPIGTEEDRQKEFLVNAESSDTPENLKRESIEIPRQKTTGLEGMTENSNLARKSKGKWLKIALLAAVVMLGVVLGMRLFLVPRQKLTSASETLSETDDGELQTRLRLKEIHPEESLTSWLKKAESAMATGHYTTPSDDNVVDYCNHVLAKDPQNLRTLDLKKEGIKNALSQAQEWIHKGKFKDARELYLSLLELSSSESQLPPSVPEIKEELKKLEFTIYSVVHDHFLGSCQGKLKINSYVLSFVPSGASKHGFTEHFSDIALGELGNKLKIQVKNKTYRFESNSGRSKEEKMEIVKVIYDHLSRQLAKPGVVTSK